MRRYWPEIIFFTLAGLVAAVAVGWQWGWIPPRRLYFLIEHRWILITVFAIISGSAYWLDERRTQRLSAAAKPKPGVCSRCGYDLRATPDRCPECGHKSGK